MKLFFTIIAQDYKRVWQFLSEFQSHRKFQKQDEIGITVANFWQVNTISASEFYKSKNVKVIKYRLP